MTHKIKKVTYKIGDTLPSTISIKEVEELLYRGYAVKEVNLLDGSTRVLFLYDEVLYIRAICDPLTYIRKLPESLADASTLGGYLVTIMVQVNGGKYTLSIIERVDTAPLGSIHGETYKTLDTLERLKDFK